MRFGGKLILFCIFGGIALARPLHADDAPDYHAVAPGAEIQLYVVPADREPHLSDAQAWQLLRSHVKYIFVIYQENRSFDSYFGAFPGADGLYSRPPAQTPGFYQELINTDGSITTIHPFRIGPAQFASDTSDIDHSHARIVQKMDVINKQPYMDRFAFIEERKYSPTGNPSLAAKQFGELAMAYEDGDTVPLLWRYADRFVLCDHIFQLMIGPSTPGNLSIIAAQSGQTQWMLHPDEAPTPGHSQSVPVLNDDDPFWGSLLDPFDKWLPSNHNDRPKKNDIQRNLTFASVPLTLQGGHLQTATTQDTDPDHDLPDVRHDISAITKTGKPTIAFGWYQEGFDRETKKAIASADVHPTTNPSQPATAPAIAIAPATSPSTAPWTAGQAKSQRNADHDDDDDDDPTDAMGRHASYITHHNGPQYFGYIANNPVMRENLHGLNDFFHDISAGALPESGGLFYVKGGYRNVMNLLPANPDPAVQKAFRGDDDHPAYSDSQISEAMVANAINSIAASRYWNQCAIIVTWDDSEGDYDHIPPPIRAIGPDGLPLSDGPRVPMLVISPYCKVHEVDHAVGNHASVIKFADALFNLIPLAELPDELRGRQIGVEKYGQENLGPADALTPDVTDLLGAFDPARLTGAAAPLPASYVTIPDKLIYTLPQISGYGCKDLGITPVDQLLGIKNEIPPDFSPRPKNAP